MRILVPTIQHTGSWFVVYHLLGVKQSIPSSQDGDGVVFLHTMPHAMDDILAELSTTPAVAPLRHPAAIWESWARRGKDREDLFTQTRNFWDISDRLEILPIDHPDRELFLNRVSSYLGLDLRTNWQQVNHYDGPRSDKSDRHSFDEYVEAFIPLFSRFYTDL